MRKRILVRISNIVIVVGVFELIVEGIFAKMGDEGCEGTNGVEEYSAKGILWKGMINMKLKSSAKVRETMEDG